MDTVIAEPINFSKQVKEIIHNLPDPLLTIGRLVRCHRTERIMRRLTTPDAGTHSVALSFHRIWDTSFAITVILVESLLTKRFALYTAKEFTVVLKESLAIKKELKSQYYKNKIEFHPLQVTPVDPNAATKPLQNSRTAKALADTKPLQNSKTAKALADTKPLQNSKTAKALADTKPLQNSKTAKTLAAKQSQPCKEVDTEADTDPVRKDILKKSKAVTKPLPPLPEKTEQDETKANPTKGTMALIPIS